MFISQSRNKQLNDLNAAQRIISEGKPEVERPRQGQRPCQGLRPYSIKKQQCRTRLVGVPALLVMTDCKMAIL